MLDEFGGLATADRRALGSTRWSPDPVTFEAGYAKLCATHPELSRGDLSPHPNLLQLGTRLWREGRRDRDVDEDDENDEEQEEDQEQEDEEGQEEEDQADGDDEDGEDEDDKDVRRVGRMFVRPQVRR